MIAAEMASQQWGRKLDAGIVLGVPALDRLVISD